MDVQKMDRFMSIPDGDSSNIKWLSPKLSPFTLVGFPWIKKDNVYRRLPLKSNYKIPNAVNSLANCTSGGQIKFKTDSNSIHIKAKLTGVSNMNHMPATGQCGFDCYISNNGELYYCSTTKYDHTKDHYQCELYKHTKNILKDVVINFPLYQGVEEVFIGLENDCIVAECTKYSYDKNIVFYGTSITQGGCASRPGMSYTNILSRKLNANCINLGFSGNGCGEPELAHIISEIKDIELLVLDYQANCVSTELFMKTLPDFIRIFREIHKITPILVVSRIPFSMDIFYENILNDRIDRNEFQQNWVNSLRKQGDLNTYYFDLSSVFEEDFYECTVDGIHPTDLGFSLIAKKLYDVINKII